MDLTDEEILEVLSNYTDEITVTSMMGRQETFKGREIIWKEIYKFVWDEPDTREEDIPRRGWA